MCQVLLYRIILLVQLVTLHVSVWVEIHFRLSCNISWFVTLHVSVWVEIKVKKFRSICMGVTLHVSVWVEISTYAVYLKRSGVTLHVSVWVEIFIGFYSNFFALVTLHVSVWVEIYKNVGDLVRLTSRSTWACELKCNFDAIQTILHKSRSTWACELKFYGRAKRYEDSTSHAPRERVSWNTKAAEYFGYDWVTLHVSVWVEICRESVWASSWTGHAPRERVSWNMLVF